MGPRSQSRRQVLKTGAAVASLGLVGSLAGCSGFGGGGDGTQTPDGKGGAGGGITGDVPVGSDVVMSLDFQAMLDDQPIRDAINEALQAQASDNSKIPSSVSAAFDKLEQETDVDVRKVQELAIFGKSNSGNGTDSEYVGMLAYTDWSPSKIRDLLKKYEQHTGTSEYKGVTVYVNDDPNQTTEKLAVLSDGTVVLGRQGATEDVIDLRKGDAEPMSGQLREGWQATSGGYARMAVDIDDEDVDSESSPVDSVEYAYGSVYADGDMRGVQMSVETGTEKGAKELKGIIESRLTLAEQKADDQRTREFLANTTVSVSGTTVTVRNEVDVATITPVVTKFASLFLTELSGQSIASGTEPVSA